jgi:hypothetical protein
MRRFAFAAATFMSLTLSVALARADQSFRLGVQWEKLA